MWLFRSGAAVVVGLTCTIASSAAAQTSCQDALPAFTAAMRANTVEALTAYLNDHGQCFEAPARARLTALGGATPAAPTEPPAQAADPKPQRDPSCEQYANARSEKWDQPLNFNVTNRTDMELSVAWIDYEGKRGEPQTVHAGGTYGGGTFVTHLFEFTSPDGACVKIIAPQAGVEEYVVDP